MSAESGISDATSSAQDASADGSHSSDAAGGESDGGNADAGEAGAALMDASSNTESGSSNDSGSSGTPDAGAEPCDIYQSGGAPCVAAHSTVRALYGDFSGNLYQVTRASDKTTKDIGVLATGGFANSATQDAFCLGTTCTISIIYDQSPKGNHLTPGPGGGEVSTADKPASATSISLTISGHKVYGIQIEHDGEGYRIDKTSGVAIGDEPETEYMVTSSKDLYNGCCFDYGNAEANNHNDGNGTMEAVYFGFGSAWGTGTGKGPWVEVDLENGLWAGGGTDPQKGVSTNTPLTSTYVTAMVVGRSGSFALKGGNAQMGTLTTMYDGLRPNGYNPMKKQGSVLLGIGGDNSDTAGGDFFEGVVTFGNAPPAIDDAVQANIVAAGYGH